MFGILVLTLLDYNNISFTLDYDSPILEPDPKPNLT